MIASVSSLAGFNHEPGLISDRMVRLSPPPMSSHGHFRLDHFEKATIDHLFWLIQQKIAEHELEFGAAVEMKQVECFLKQSASKS